MRTADALASLSAVELGAVAGLWKRERRELLTSFSGTSMQPAIVPGQMVVVECGIEPAVGDVAAFRINERIVVHRVVARSATWLLTWGDANSLPDEPVDPQRVIGAIRNVPAARRSLNRMMLLRFLASPHAEICVLMQRIRLAHRVRSAWAQGPFVLTTKVFRATIRRKPPC